MEGETKIFETERNGRTFKNIDIKRGNVDFGIAPLPRDHYVVVTKKFDEGREFSKTFSGNSQPTKSYLIVVEYKGEDVAFFMTEREHDMFKLAGGAGDEVRLYHRRLERNIKNPDGTTTTKAYSQIESMAHNKND